MFEVQWSSSGKATAMGQLAFFAEFLQASGLFEHWLQSCPLHYTSPNAPNVDKLARQIERHHAKPPEWLDLARGDHSVTPAEKAFLELALRAWRASSNAGCKALREGMKQAAAVGDPE